MRCIVSLLIVVVSQIPCLSLRAFEPLLPVRHSYVVQTVLGVSWPGFQCHRSVKVGVTFLSETWGCTFFTEWVVGRKGA